MGQSWLQASLVCVAPQSIFNRSPGSLSRSVVKRETLTSIFIVCGKSSVRWIHRRPEGARFPPAFSWCIYLATLASLYTIASILYVLLYTYIALCSPKVFYRFTEHCDKSKLILYKFPFILRVAQSYFFTRQKFNFEKKLYIYYFTLEGRWFFSSYFLI